MSTDWLTEVLAAIEPAAANGDGRAAVVLGLLRAQLNGTEAIDDRAHLERIRSTTDRRERKHIVARIALETWPHDDRSRRQMERRLRGKLKSGTAQTPVQI